jgi:hypothetical protein
MHRLHHAECSMGPNHSFNTLVTATVLLINSLFISSASLHFFFFFFLPSFQLHMLSLFATSEQDGVRTALEFETQIASLRQSLSLRDEENKQLLASFGDLERRVMGHGMLVSSGIYVYIHARVCGSMGFVSVHRCADGLITFYIFQSVLAMPNRKSFTFCKSKPGSRCC